MAVKDLGNVGSTKIYGRLRAVSQTIEEVYHGDIKD